MPEYWNIKVLAKTEGEARVICERAMQALGVAVRNVEFKPYWKFPDHWECHFKTTPGGAHADPSPLEASARRFAILAIPRSEVTHPDNTGERTRLVYEALADARWDMVHIPGLRWVSLISETRAPRGS